MSDCYINQARPKQKVQFPQLAGFWLVLIPILLVGSNLAYTQNSIAQIDIRPAPGLADDFISEVDVLFVYEERLLNQLPFTQFEWISGKQQYLERDDNLLELMQFQVTANSELQQVALTPRHNLAVGILVFASHEDPVAEAIDISYETRILLQIESYGINVEPIEN